MIITKKTWPEMFNKVLSGEKTFDARIADFEVNEGDTLVLKEFDPVKGDYTGRKIERKVGYVLKTKDQKFWSKEDIDKYGLQIIGFK